MERHVPADWVERHARATLMTLFIIPLIYDTFNKKELRKIDDAEPELTEE